MNLEIPNVLRVLPFMTAFATNPMKKKMGEVGTPPVQEYLQMLVDGGAKLYACKMTVDMIGLKVEDFVEGVRGVASASDLLKMGQGGQIIFI